MFHSLWRFLILFVGMLPTLGFAQQPVTIRVDASARQGAFKPAWNYFGYDEPNYTYSANGRKLIHELAALSETPVHIRTHNLLTTGNGVAALKWGSTNAYTEDSGGRPVYDWAIVDKVLGTYLEEAVRPFVEIGFMPEALSTHPQPYQHTFPRGDVYTGWAYPPKDYDKWGELVYQLVKHCIEKYGKAEAESWDWEVWNEPNIGYWHGTPEEYDKLYDCSVAAVRRALPTAHVGGPASTGPGGVKAAAFLNHFLEHCSRSGSPLDFISFHAKGRPKLVHGRVQMGLSQQLNDVEQGFKIVRSFPKFRNLPIVLSESDPEGCAACSAQTNPQNAYRNGPLYPVYLAAAMKGILELAGRYQVNLQGILTWAFEFENQPYFAGFRTLATNGIDKPVLNFFRMTGLMEGDRVKTDGQSGSVEAFAVRSDHEVSVMLWNYLDTDVSGPGADVNLQIAGLPVSAKRLLLRHYRIDQDYSNAYTDWKRMGSPQKPGLEQYGKLEAAGQLQMLTSPRWIDNASGAANVKFSLPLQGLSLVQLSW